MTTPKNPLPRTEPVRPRSQAEHQQLAASAQTTRVVAILALVLAVVGVGLAAAPIVLPKSSCQDQAWAVTPSTGDLPASWTIAGTQYNVSQKTMSFLGPLPEDQYTAPAQVISTITCFDQGAADAVSRSEKASKDADQSVVERDDLGDQSFSAVDSSGATFLQLRTGRVVVYLAGSAEASATEVDQVASAFDKALGGDGGEIAPATPIPSDLGAGSPDPNASAPAESPAAPDLMAMLPTQVGDIQLDVSSQLGSQFFGQDQSSRAILAALRAAGKEPDDFRIAQATDVDQVSDLVVLAVTVDGLPVAQTKNIVLDVFLVATGPGIVIDKVTLGGREWERVDYGTEGVSDWLATDGDVVLMIETDDPALAEQAAAALP